MTSAFSWQNSISLCPASFHIPRPNLPVTPGNREIQKTKILTSGPTTSWEIDGETVETVADFIFVGAPKSLQMVTAAMKLRDTCSLEGSYDQPRQHIKKQTHYFANKCLSSQSYIFSSSHEWM